MNKPMYGRARCAVARVAIRDGDWDGEPWFARGEGCAVPEETARVVAARTPDDRFLHDRQVGPVTLKLIREIYGPYGSSNAMRAWDV